MAVHLAVAGDVFDGVLFGAVLFSTVVLDEISQTELNQFLRIFLPTLCKSRSSCTLMWAVCSGPFVSKL